MKRATWAVVMTVDEPAVLVLANVAWHLGTGASEVHVYLDRPDDPVAVELEKLSGVRVVRCDEAHWQALAPKLGRPPLQMRRQGLSANHARAQSQADWIVHLDADEFLHQSAPLSREFACFSGLEHEIRFPVWERAYAEGAPITGLFDGVFRTTTKPLRPMEEAILGADRPFLIDGMAGHSEGKCAVPVHGNWRIGIHWSFRGKGKESKSARVPSRAARLLHFDGLTPLHFLVKLARYASHTEEDLRRLVSNNRHVQIAEFLKGPMRLHDRVRVLDAAKRDWLAGFGVLSEERFAPEAVIAEVLGSAPDLSVEAFDAALRARYPEAVEAVEALGG